MERLTARTENGNAYLVNVKPDEQEVDSPYKNTLQCILDCFERLAQYEDAEEQGLLVRLPCKVGDTVYRVEGDEVYDEWQIVFVVVYPDEIVAFDDSENEIRADDIGKTVFLTLAEAEAALEGKG